ncbi:threonine synthase [Saccharicrinis fermentans]|uniref:Threonine synthase n=1 Tax=Saccharicrinis fermentans DSM 9555 = JCM 21142 TaxID=869213 RepID=W7Y743_9BACT|nr:threonine synthase [Saccharicrinis fermentans]GAF03498.1 threonine synthase [Saccharicrinis fermentans DSM 9555 = JCM 21142]
MQFYSTNSPDVKVSLKEAVLRGLASDKGLFMPEVIPHLDASFFGDIQNKSLPEIGFEVLKPFFCPDIPEETFKAIVEDALNFPIPTVPVSKNIYSLELFHGPTLAFKDVGARFMARILSYFVQDQEKEINILVATSGDTGSAVANGFFEVPGINVFVLYPKGLVSQVQEKQFTTLGKNITSIEVDGTFDDCQRMVKEAFLDQELNDQLVLTSANSINLARLLPQSVYYHHAYAQLKKAGIKEDVVFCVPSGNFGNLTAGLVAREMGLPVKKFIAATNINDIVPKYLVTGEYVPAPSKSTIANAMDVGDPSNFVRIMDLYDADHSLVSARVEGLSYTDDEIRVGIKRVDDSCRYVMDPHGATAFMALENKLKSGEMGVFLETAHPAKFPEVVETVIGRAVVVPERLQAFMKGVPQSSRLSANLKELKAFLLK